MYIISKEKLEPGDIILTRSSNRESKLIRKMTNSSYSHAILYMGNSSCIESDGLGVQSKNIDRMLFELNDDVLILRLKSPNFNLDKVVEFARVKIGTEYSSSEARQAVNGNLSSATEENRQFCTRFVGQAYEYANIEIVKNPNYCTPQDILESKELIVIEDFIRIATPEDIEFAESEDPTVEQTLIHNTIFESARNIFSMDIQNFEQLAIAILKQPDKDLELVKLIKKSGYLDMWKKDIERNPWFYNISDFNNKYLIQLEKISVAKQIVENEEIERVRYIESRDSLTQVFNKSGLQYFKIMIELYDKLIEISRNREQLGVQIIEIGVLNMIKNKTERKD